MNSQEERILNYMEQGYSITPMGALNLFGSFRLGARIHSLKKAGHNISSRLRVDPISKKRFSEYSLTK